jgi:hypothetical protein
MQPAPAAVALGFCGVQHTAAGRARAEPLFRAERLAGTERLAVKPLLMVWALHLEYEGGSS